jgi:transposase-like protein
VAAEPTDKVILDIRISFERTILVAEKFLKDLIKKYGNHPLSTDMVELGIRKLVDL